jgi:hypothetical protein
MPPVAEQERIAIGVGSAPSAAFDKRTRLVMVNCDAACSLAFSLPGDPDPEAAVEKHRQGQNETRFYGVTPGGKLAVIGNT